MTPGWFQAGVFTYNATVTFSGVCWATFLLLRYVWAKQIHRFLLPVYTLRDPLAAPLLAPGTLITFCSGHCDLPRISPITEAAEHLVVCVSNS